MTDVTIVGPLCLNIDHHSMNSKNRKPSMGHSEYQMRLSHLWHCWFSVPRLCLKSFLKHYKMPSRCGLLMCVSHSHFFGLEVPFMLSCCFSSLILLVWYSIKSWRQDWIVSLSGIWYYIDFCLLWFGLLWDMIFFSKSLYVQITHKNFDLMTRFLCIHA